MAASKPKRIAGWALSLLIAALLLGPSAMGKFLPWEGKEEAMSQLGYTVELIKKIGVVEVVIALLFLVPRTAFVATVLLTGYLGGATATHVRVGDPFVMPIAVGVLAWVALGLRQPGVFGMAFGAGTRAAAADEPAA